MDAARIHVQTQLQIKQIQIIVRLFFSPTQCKQTASISIQLKAKKSRINSGSLNKVGITRSFLHVPCEFAFLLFLQDVLHRQLSGLWHHV